MNNINTIVKRTDFIEVYHICYHGIVLYTPNVSYC